MKLFVDHRCILCDATSNDDFCIACETELPWFPENHCPICLWPVPTSEVCGACLKKPPAFTRSIAVLRYTFPVDALIRSLKYQSHLAIAPILANLFLKQFNHSLQPLPDLIIPMPLHPIRLRERGFNQAIEISKPIAKRLKIPLMIDHCSRIRDTTPQADLPWSERQKNVHKAFHCDSDLSGQHVAIIDDVMTTGATLNELAKTLRQQGAAEISNWIIARTLSDKSITK
ncbi:MAG TPA: ComF family protein [Nitrosomonas sp.]|nr:ComF family protein [Nitrosomonas sp.]HQX13138.1 ComF family protein [Nitrosomonas sp.]HRB32672.1 ComF family protein [Nitrosomonas sp.]HRB45071.1 ComF family protein [Nitrosomonas sp.]HRB77388.1 ComF family protein [Nitrosomonas sp.]